MATLVQVQKSKFQSISESPRFQIKVNIPFLNLTLFPSCVRLNSTSVLPASSYALPSKTSFSSLFPADRSNNCKYQPWWFYRTKSIRLNSVYPAHCSDADFDFSTAAYPYLCIYRTPFQTLFERPFFLLIFPFFHFFPPIHRATKLHPIFGKADDFKHSFPEAEILFIFYSESLFRCWPFFLHPFACLFSFSHSFLFFFSHLNNTRHFIAVKHLFMLQVFKKLLVLRKLLAFFLLQLSIF